MKMLKLKKNYEFQNVYRNGKYFSDRQMVFYIVNNDKRENRYGISAGKKVGGSVERNRVKRLIKEALKRHAYLLKPGSDIVILARAGIKGERFNTVEKSFLRLINRVNNNG